MNQIAIMESKIEVLCRQLDDKDLELKTVRLAHAVEKDFMQTRLTAMHQAAEYWKEQADDLKKDLALNAKMLARQCDLAREAETQALRLRCCGNCKHYTPRGDCRSKHEYAPGRYCDHWTQDGLTRKDRE